MTAALADVALLLRPDDDVAVATRDLSAGSALDHAGGELVLTRTLPRGHKVAVRAPAPGDAVHKYGQVIGRATAAIAPGDHVHVHNVGMDAHTGVAHEFGTGRVALPAPREPRTFEGYARGDGRVATRQYVGIVTSVNCSASTARLIADQFRGPVLDAYPHVDGVVALTHDSGCGLVPTSEGGQVLRRTLRGYATHPNMAGVLVLGLGCEMVTVAGLLTDLLAAHGGTSVLAETPEVFGAEHLPTRRAVSREVGRRLLDRIDWWQEYVAAGGGTLDNNPSPGNKAGGLTTIPEKSLGAVAKAGTAELAAVYEYAEPITTHGLGFMDTPGYDPVSVTGLVAGGATVVCRQTVSEELDLGADEFIPWQLGAVT